MLSPKGSEAQETNFEYPEPRTQNTILTIPTIHFELISRLMRVLGSLLTQLFGKCTGLPRLVVRFPIFLLILLVIFYFHLTANRLSRFLLRYRSCIILLFCNFQDRIEWICRVKPASSSEKFFSIHIKQILNI